MPNGYIMKGRVRRNTIPSMRYLLVQIDRWTGTAWEPVQEHKITKEGIVPDDTTGPVRWRVKFNHLTPLRLHRVQVTRAADVNGMTVSTVVYRHVIRPTA